MTRHSTLRTFLVARAARRRNLRACASARRRSETGRGASARADSRRAEPFGRALLPLAARRRRIATWRRRRWPHARIIDAARCRERCAACAARHRNCDREPRSAGSCRMQPSCGRSSIPRPNVRSACSPHSPPIHGSASIPSSAADDELRSRIERVLADAALSGPGRRRSVHADQPAVLAAVGQARRAVAGPRCRETVSEDARSALRGRARRVRRGRRHGNRIRGERRRSTVRSSCARTGNARRSSRARSSGANRPRLRSRWLEAFVAAHPAAKSATGALAQHYVEQKRFTEARALMQKLWDREPESRDLEFAVAAIALQMKD